MLSLLLLSTATALLRGSSVAKVESVTEVKVPAFDSVLTMLDNLVKQIDEEAQNDDADYKSYMTWFTAEHSKVSASIGSLSNRLQELAATLAGLRSRAKTLTGEVNRLSSELDHERGQLAEAQAKRQEEHAAFVNEQTDFDNSIAACGKATELLKAHYGDGSPKTIAKPAWMSLVVKQLRTVHAAASKHHAKLPPALTSLIQASYHARADEQMLGLLQGKIPQAPGSSLYDEYQDQTGTAMGIVAQIKELGETFSDDKQEAIEAEHDLQAAFDSVLNKKTEIINTLQSQYNQQQSVLTQVSQEIGESETAEQTAQGQLQNEQAYLGSIETQERDTTAMYQARQKDRADEKTAVQMAVQVLMEKAPALLQLRRSWQQHQKALLQLQVGSQGQCVQCNRAAKLLRKDASKLHSELLSTAAAMTASGSTLGPVVAQLEGLLTRLDEQGVQEKEHKDWCESEQTETNAKKTHHDGLVTELTQQISDTKEVIAEKVQGLADTKSAIDDLDASFKEVTGIREKAKSDYEAEHADYVAAITALNQAIDILADFYREQQALVQRSAHSSKQVPDSLQSGYSKKGGAGVVTLIKGTRGDFEAGKANLELFEKKAVEDYENDKSTYESNRAALVDAGNRLMAELQTAKASLSTYESDLKSNEDASAAAASYLAQLGGSCGTLLAHFEDRVAMRAQERKAISDAVDVLRAV